MHITQEASPGEGTLGVPIRRVSFQGDNDYWTGGIQPRGTLVQVEHKSMCTPGYSSLSNKRAGWNKRAGRKFCQILGNFENSNLCRVDLRHF